LSRIGPELTDQRYCGWGAIRPTPVMTRVASTLEKNPLT
jgi:hypothetical protein